MVRTILESILGPLGISVLDAYYEHSLPINAVVLLYGLVMLVAWSNLSRARSYLVGSVSKQLESNGRAGRKMRVEAARRVVDIPYEEALNLVRIPLVAPWSALVPRRAGRAVIEGLLPAREIVAEALDRMDSLSDRDGDLLARRRQWWR